MLLLLDVGDVVFFVLGEHTLHSEAIWGVMISWVTVGHLRVTVGHFRATVGHLRVTKRHLRVSNTDH